MWCEEESSRPSETKVKKGQTQPHGTLIEPLRRDDRDSWARPGLRVLLLYLQPSLSLSLSSHLPPATHPLAPHITMLEARLSQAAVVSAGASEPSTILVCLPLNPIRSHSAQLKKVLDGMSLLRAPACEPIADLPSQPSRSSSPMPTSTAARKAL